MSRLDVPQVVKVRGHGQMTVASTGQVHPFLLSEFLPGGDVRENLTSTGVPSDDELRAFLSQTLEGIEALHSENVIHRDMKPENIVLSQGDWTRPVIIDLGLSRLADLDSVTVYPWAGGTWHYMAPEQLRAERAIDRTDIWALAVIASELDTGDHPFRRGEMTIPPDWDSRLRAGMNTSGKRPDGLRMWVEQAGQYAAYRRPSAVQAQALLEALWP